MLKRKIYDYLLKWKENKHKKCLVIKGARQVGKTYIVNMFGENEYDSFIRINFIEQPELKQIFNSSLSADDIYGNISLFNPNYRLKEGKTLIFFDEIQECPNARAALKFLTIDGRYDVIASGSLLGISFKETTSIPVGYETQVFMYPLDFEEYLWAKGYTNEQLNVLKKAFESKEKVNNAINEIFLKLAREYIVIGGMPEVVNSFINNNDFYEVYQIQNSILNSYYDDISRYAASYEQPKIKKIYNSIPSQLAKENKKFQYSVVEKGSSARKFGNSLDWLINAGLLYPCYNVSTMLYPLKAYEKNDYFKIYVADIGLFSAMYGFDIKKSIINDTLSGPMKGGIYENFVACQIMSKEQRLYYYKSQNSDLEMEFLLERNSEIIPVEVKAKNGARSLNMILDNEKMSYGYKLINGNIGVVDKKITLPLYLIMFL